MRGDLGLRLGNGRGQVAPAHRELDRHVAPQVFAKNDRRTVLLDHICQLPKRHLGAVGRGNQNCADGAQVAPVGFSPTHSKIEVLLTFVDLGDGQPANGCLDDRRHVAGIQPIAPGGGTQGRDANRRLAERAKDSQVRHPPDVLHGGDDLASLVFVHPQIRSHHLDRVLALDARHGLFHVVGDDLREIEHHAGKGAGQVALHIVGE